MIGNHCKRCLFRIRNSAALNCIGCIAPCNNNIRSLLSFVSPPQTKGFSPFHQVLPVPLIPYQKEILVGFKTDTDIFYGTRIHHGYEHCKFALLDVFFLLKNGALYYSTSGNLGIGNSAPEYITRKCPCGNCQAQVARMYMVKKHTFSLETFPMRFQEGHQLGN